MPNDEEVAADSANDVENVAAADGNEEQEPVVGEMPDQMEGAQQQDQDYKALESEPAAAEKPTQIEQQKQDQDYVALEFEEQQANGEKATQSQDYEAL